ncbi:DNA-binding response regulator [Brevibacillus reuszeri]|uniref:DNA-binding response regulator n=1 Tax=Brevibacillus reuszeri TaxID=54915 RepID=A0ABQ0TQ69_9BACL|nr:response regulator transcription factor [Brevibacillus reuszeri]MED1861509.1 response regulator transcription factor [Brevibacillus reuszeri]GED70057.1 DNA-binding response regulator [Brevibacillus reuszeri]
MIVINHSIFIMEDDQAIVEMVETYLTKEGYAVTVAGDGDEGLRKFEQAQGRFDLLLVDLMMPKIDGMEVIRRIRAYSHVPILIMSAKDSDIDKALGLGFGADDYIEKPFSMIELSARLKAIIRRATKYASVETNFAPKHTILNMGDLRIEFDNYAVFKHEEPIKLTSKEFEILRLLAAHPNRVFTKAQIYAKVWNDDYYGDENVINVHMSRLRDKIEDKPSEPRYIKTLWGIGYKWEGR